MVCKQWGSTYTKLSSTPLHCLMYHLTEKEFLFTHTPIIARSLGNWFSTVPIREVPYRSTTTVTTACTLVICDRRSSSLRISRTLMCNRTPFATAVVISNRWLAWLGFFARKSLTKNFDLAKHFKSWLLLYSVCVSVSAYKCVLHACTLHCWISPDLLYVRVHLITLSSLPYFVFHTGGHLHESLPLLHGLLHLQ